MKAVSIRFVALLVVLFIGLFFLFIGLFSFDFVSSFINQQIAQNKQLLENSDAVKKWTNIKLPVYMKYRLFNLTNPDAVVNGEVPILNECGPYVFREIFKFDIIGWNEDQTLITYRKRKFYHYEPELSGGTLNDMVTMLNLPFISLTTKLLRASTGVDFMTRTLINSAIRKSNAKPFITRRVGELLFEGYTEELFETFASVLSKISSDVPKDGRFALMKNRNGSDDGEFTIHTGKDDILNFASIKTWNGKSSIDCWNGTECGKIKGTDGTMYHPNISPDERLYLFNADVNRSIYLQYESDVSVYKLNAYKFTIPLTAFRAPFSEEDNKCYCVKDDEESLQLGGQRFCSLDGVLDMHVCKKGLPLVLSMPHFYGGDKLLFKQVTGLAPTKDQHENYAYIDPVTGIVVSAARRLQISIQLTNKFNKKIKVLSKMKDMILPVIWFEETFMITEPLADKLWTLVHKKILTVKHYLMISVIVGLTIIATVFLTVVWIYVKNNFINDKKKAKDTKAEYSYSDLKKGFDASQQEQQIATEQI